MIVTRLLVIRTCALALALCGYLSTMGHARGQSPWSAHVEQGAATTSSSFSSESWIGQNEVGEPQRSIPVAFELGGAPSSVGSAEYPRLAQATPVGDSWIAPPDERTHFVDSNSSLSEPVWNSDAIAWSGSYDVWCWQVLPDGLIYRSYQAGVHEPRLSIVAFGERDGRSLWDGTLGGRVGIFRYGTCDDIFPQGWQLDIEAAAMVRLTLDEIRDFETADYRVGIPLTYGVENWQFKFGMYHLSSHLGDEFAIANPGSLDDRINYVRDALVLGASVYPNPAVRLYSEAAYAVNVDGGAAPWEFQLGTEISRAGPTGLHGTPFLAINAHLREEHDFGGDITAQTGWLWRAREGQVMRLGLHYFNGKSSQYQTFDDSEEQIGFGLWYDF